MVGEDPLVARGREVFFRETNCMLCHSIQGTIAPGVIGPNLTRIGGRSSIAAGMLENTPGEPGALDSGPEGGEARGSDARRRLPCVLRGPDLPGHERQRRADSGLGGLSLQHEVRRRWPEGDDTHVGSHRDRPGPFRRPHRGHGASGAG